MNFKEGYEANMRIFKFIMHTPNERRNKVQTQNLVNIHTFLKFTSTQGHGSSVSTYASHLFYTPVFRPKTYVCLPDATLSRRASFVTQFCTSDLIFSREETLVPLMLTFLSLR